MARQPSVKDRLGKFFLDNIGRVVSHSELWAVAEPATSFPRRIRELRAEGWLIHTNNDNVMLKPGEYILVKEPSPEALRAKQKQISARIKAQVLAHYGSTCQMCGKAAGEIYENGRPVRMHASHIIDRAHGGEDTFDNLTALCSDCNQGAKNLIAEPPRWIWLKSQLRQSGREDQQRAYEWLKDYLGEGD